MKLLALILAASGLVAPAHHPAAEVWADQAVGFAAGTTGGSGGAVVRATTLAELRAYAAAAEPLTIRVAGSILVDPFGDMIRVGSDKTITGEGAGAELVGGGLFLDGTHNVIIRNLTIRDSYIPGDFDGKTADNDNDGIRLDTADHVWIDHTLIERVGDGGIDIRKDSDHITLSWNIISDINKALGVGWTANVVTRLTAHHNWIRNTVQRNWSLDNTLAAHLYDNYLSDVAQYGTMARNYARVVVEDSTFEHVNDPLVVLSPTAGLVQRGNRFSATSGRTDSGGAAFDPASYYPYASEPADVAARNTRQFAGPHRRAAVTPRRITVALDGSGDYGSLLAALGAVRDATGPVTIAVGPGVFREIVRVWPARVPVTVTGTAETVLTYDLSPDGTKFYGGTWGAGGAATLGLLGDGNTVRGLTVAGSVAVRTAGDRAVLDRVRIDGGYQADGGRTHLRDCTLAGRAAGAAVAVLDRCTVLTDTPGTIAAPTTPARERYGFLFSRCVFDGAAPAGTVHLGESGQIVVRDSVLGAQIAAAPWTGSGRFAEYRNRGPGVGTGPDRPQLTAARATAFTVAAYLR
ncbi:pectinesterase family protein [Paractinoplanes toevensis]|uniref:Pectate lyase domain-containing protein n=1 Tax=Paractinoplanes toevensis TaxID=571911 RepID=A0A919T8A0_9ACTN|nr:pectinesterase family protein [Actinoplanes toevensis]GIM89549.1 hypothetical protein Ato02nite_013420 [Actinoplanes toevensis]